MNGRYFDLESFANAIQLQQPSQQAPQQQRYSQNGPCLEDYDPTTARLIDPLSMMGYNSTTQHRHQTVQQQQQQHQHHQQQQQQQHHRTLMPSSGAPGAGGNNGGTGARHHRAAPMAAPPGTLLGGVPGSVSFGMTDFEPLPLSKPMRLNGSVLGGGGGSSSSSHHRSSHMNNNINGTSTTTNGSSSGLSSSGNRMAAAVARANSHLQMEDDIMLNSPAAAMFPDLFGPSTSVSAACSSNSSSHHHNATTTSSSSRRRQQQQQHGRSNNSSRSSSAQQHQLAAVRPPPPLVVPEAWLEAIQVSVSGLSLEPLSGTEITTRLRSKTEDVVTRYLPCVDFLVACQQELRKGLASAQQKRLVHHMLRDAMTPRQFYNTYIEPLPDRFYRKNRRLMDPKALTAAVQEIQKLCKDASGAEVQGCEVMKNTFLGGMKDGESWGLRKWLSKNGGALQICNDCECILNACQKLDRSASSTSKLAGRLRPMAKKALTRLKSDVPSSYQEISSAHPYLPFFHRLESTLKGMSNFDPEDDDVICIDDDDEIEEVKAQAAVSKPATSTTSRKRNRDSSSAAAGTTSKKSASSASSSNGRASSSNKKQKTKYQAPPPPALDNMNFDDDDDDDSVIEVFDSKPKAYASPKKNGKAKDKSANDTYTTNHPASSVGSVGSDDEYMSALFSTFDDAETDIFDTSSATGLRGSSPTKDMIFAAAAVGSSFDAHDMAAGIERLALMFDTNREDEIRPDTIAIDFWDENDNYASALRLFADILRAPESSIYVDEMELGDYASIIKHPLCLREIFAALLEDDDGSNNFDDDTRVLTRGSSGGQLLNQGLSSWNMWKGLDLLQAIDLVFVNSLAYGRAMDEGRSNRRSQTNKIRKTLWDGIKHVIDENVGIADQELRKRCTPTRRGESSGFVVHKS